MAIDMKAIHDSQRTLVMGVLNITEDSFSDGGLWLAPEAAKAHGEAMMKPVPTSSTSERNPRPGAKRVSEADEKARVLGAVDALIPEGAVLSIDTTRASVALAALEHGAQIINDVSGGQLDRELPHVWPTIPTACTSCSIGVAGLPAPRAMCRTPTPPATSMAW